MFPRRRKVCWHRFFTKASFRCLLSFLNSVESSDVNWKKKKSGGIKIICQSEARDFSAMAFITDHVNSLIDQWFPGKRTAVIFCVVLCLYNRKFFSKALQVHNTVC